MVHDDEERRLQRALWGIGQSNGGAKHEIDRQTADDPNEQPQTSDKTREKEKRATTSEGCERTYVPDMKKSLFSLSLSFRGRWLVEGRKEEERRGKRRDESKGMETEMNVGQQRSW